MKTFTLHASCLTALDAETPEAEALRKLLAAQATGKAHLAIAALSVQDHPEITKHAQFSAYLDEKAFGGIEILRPMAYFDVSLADWNILSTPEQEDLEREIHAILFPNVQFFWRDFRFAHGIAEKSPPFTCPWRQCKADVQAIWTHIEAERDVFVTADSNFHTDKKKQTLTALGARSIAYPEEAAAMLQEN